MKTHKAHRFDRMPVMSIVTGGLMLLGMLSLPSQSLAGRGNIAPSYPGVVFNPHFHGSHSHGFHGGPDHTSFGHLVDRSGRGVSRLPNWHTLMHSGYSITALEANGRPDKVFDPPLYKHQYGPKPFTGHASQPRHSHLGKSIRQAGGQR